MDCRNLIGALLLFGVSWPTGDARGWDDAKYPNWKGQWVSINPPLGGGTPVKFDPTKAAGPAQEAPLTPEYQKVLEIAWRTKPMADLAITQPPGVS